MKTITTSSINGIKLEYPSMKDGDIVIYDGEMYILKKGKFKPYKQSINEINRLLQPGHFTLYDHGLQTNIQTQ